ncbi:MAG: DUF2283 domain-containing protein [Verrucomicrobia bacterium]|nr:DUF2283 domain-containing protein [Verrucomicrobiota bacterium]
MKSGHTDIMMVNCKTPPTVEIDTKASAAYVRFKRAKIARTLRHRAKWPIVTIDVDARGQVVGLELVGVKKFNLGYLLEQASVKATPDSLDRVNYVSAEGHLSPA